MENLFGTTSKPQKAVEPPPTRDTAAEAIAAAEAEDKKRRSWSNGSGSTQLTPTGGVTSDLTGLRMLTRAS